MPIYEYRCESCGETLEKIQKFSDPPLQDCPACGKPALKKLVSASSFRLKGSGWYETDFKTKKTPGKDTNSDSSGGGGKNGSTGKGEKAATAANNVSNKGDSAGTGKNSGKPASGD